MLPLRILCLFFALELHAASPDRAVLTALRNSAADTDTFRLLKRLPVTSELDLVLAIGAEKNWGAGWGPYVWWGDHRTLGIFLQRRDRPSLLYNIATVKGHGDCAVQVERATARETVLSCTPEKGWPGPNHKFVYNLASKALVKHIEYQPFSLQRILVSGSYAVLVGSDTQRLAAVKFNPADEPDFQFLRGSQARQWTQRVATTEGTMGSGSDLKHLIYLQPEQFKPVHFGPGNRFTLASENNRLLVLDRTGKTVKRYPLPQSTYRDFARLRPARVRNGYTKEATTIDEGIGPWQIADGTLWFAKGFYDGEGHTGIGGFGYFDTAMLKYQMYSPPQLADWSATAILVEPDVVWLGIANNGEYRSSGGGLIRFARATQTAERIGFPEVVNEIARVGDYLLFATDFGAAVYKDHTLRRFFLDHTTKGSLQVSESIFGN